MIWYEYAISMFLKLLISTLNVWNAPLTLIIFSENVVLLSFCIWQYILLVMMHLCECARECVCVWRCELVKVKVCVCDGVCLWSCVRAKVYVLGRGGGGGVRVIVCTYKCFWNQYCQLTINSSLKLTKLFS